MPNNKNRLDKLSTQLTSRQQVYKLIDKSREFQTMDDFIAWFLKEENQAGLTDIFLHSAELVKSQLKGKPAEVIQKAVQKSFREGQFLFSLNSQVAFNFHSDFYRHAYNGLLLVKMLGDIAIEAREHDGQNSEKRLTELIVQLKTWKHRATRHLYHLYHEKLLAEAIGDKHFAGRQLLFENDRQKLEQFIQQAEKLVDCQNDHIEVTLARIGTSEFPEIQELVGKFQSCLVNVEGIMSEVKADLPVAIEREEQRAKMDVYSGEEQHDKAMAILRKLGAMTA